MGIHEATTFRSRGRVALRLPESLAIAPGERLLIEAEGDLLTVRRIPDRAEVTRKLRALLEVLEANGRPRGGLPASTAEADAL
jgi:virulence-associated protein VagC